MATKVSPIAMTSIHNTPKKPIARPLKIEAARNATPFAVPTRPLALSRFSSGIMIVTSVDRAIPRKLPAIAPTSASTTNTQSMELEGSVKTTGGVETKRMPARAYKQKEHRLESIITVFLGYRSTSDPKKNPDKATVVV